MKIMNVSLVTFFLFTFLFVPNLCFYPFNDYIPDIDEVNESGYESDYKYTANNLREGDSKINIRDDFDKYQKSIDMGCECGTNEAKQSMPAIPQDTPSSGQPASAPPSDQANLRIYGGEIAVENEYPWQVALVQSNTSLANCGSSLINNRVILTAAHCVVQEVDPLETTPKLYLLGWPRSHQEFQILFHPRKLNDPEEDGNNTLVFDEKLSRDEYLKVFGPIQDESIGAERRDPYKIIVHPGYEAMFRKFGGGKFSEYDMALIILKDPVKFSNKVRPVCLPTSNRFEKYDGLGKITGWGNTNKSQLVPLRSPKLQDLSIKIVNMSIARDVFPFTELHDNLIALDNDTTADFRMFGKGDSGGPLKIYRWNSEGTKTVATQVGLCSFGQYSYVEIQNKIFRMGFHTRIAPYLEWMYEELEKIETEERKAFTWCKRPK